MAINLKKGQTIVLDKNEYDLSKLTMGLGWDVTKSEGNLFRAGGNFDLDAYAILLAENGKLKKIPDDVIYYGHLQSQDKTVVHSGDNLTGEGEGDDEQIVVELSSLASKYQKIILAVTIYNGKQRKQNFGMVQNAFVRAIDAQKKEIARYSLSGDRTYEGKVSMLMGEVYRNEGEWKFGALGKALDADLQGVVNSFMG